MTIDCIYQGRRKTYSFNQPEVIVGRSSSSGAPDLRLDFDLRVSRKHARLFVKDGDVFVEDLGSRAGVFVNCARVEAPWPLQAGDAIRIGDTVLILNAESTGADEPETRDGPSDPSTMRVARKEPEEAKLGQCADERVERRLNAWNREIFFCDRPDEGMAARLKLLYDLPLQFAVEMDPESLFKLILQRALELLPDARRASLHSRDPATGRMAVRGRVPEADQPAPGRGHVRQCAAEGLALVWSRKDEASGRQESGLCAPLIWDDRVRGVLCLDNPESGEQPFSETDLEILQAAANYAAMAIALRGW